MGGFNRLRAALADYSVRNASRARRRPRFKRSSVILMLIAASYIDYFVLVNRSGVLATMAATVLLMTPLTELLADFTRYLYFRGRRSARSTQ
jgi:hypothetical protein